MRIASDAAARIGCSMEEKAVELAATYSASGRDAVNLIQLAAGIAHGEEREHLLPRDIEWVAHTCGYALHLEPAIPQTSRVGVVTGLAVGGMGQGSILTIESTAQRVEKGRGTLELTGVVEEEELELRGRRVKRRSTARASIQNVQSAMLSRLGLDTREYDIRVNIPGGIPMDGPSAGIALFVSVLSAITNHPPQEKLALTGEIGIHGDVLPVGGVHEKLDAAIRAGAQTVVIPKENWEDSFADVPVTVIPVTDITEVLRHAFGVTAELPELLPEVLGASAIS